MTYPAIPRKNHTEVLREQRKHQELQQPPAPPTPPPTREQRAQKIRNEGLQREAALLSGRSEQELHPQEHDMLGAIRNETANRLHAILIK